MTYPHDGALKERTREVLALFRTGKSRSDPNLTHIKPGQPADLQALLHTYALHAPLVIIGDALFEGQAFKTLSALCAANRFDGAVLSGFPATNGFVIGHDVDGEVSYVAAWRDGDTELTLLKWTHGGSAGDGVVSLGGLSSGLSKLADEVVINGEDLDDEVARVLGVTPIDDEDGDDSPAPQAANKAAIDDPTVWLKKTHGSVSNGTRFAPSAVLRQLGPNDWCQTTPSHKHTLILAFDGSEYVIKVGDGTAIHALPTRIAGKSLPFCNGPIDGDFLVSNGKQLFQIDATKRTATPIYAAGKVNNLARPARDRVLCVADGHVRMLTMSGTELWSLPAPAGLELHSLGTPLVAITFEKRPACFWATVDDSGVRPVGVTPQLPLVFTTSVQVGDSVVAYAFTSWPPMPGPTYELQDPARVTTSLPHLTQLPSADELGSFPIVRLGD